MPGAKLLQSITFNRNYSQKAVEKANLDHLFFINLAVIRKMSLKSTIIKSSCCQSMELASKKQSTSSNIAVFKGAGASHIDDKYGIDERPTLQLDTR
jgi:hypothetical protein